MKKVRTRYAPSPTGYLHVGGARTALFAYLYAKHFDGDFIVRIEDTDIARNVDDGERSQLDNLKWLGIIPDESPINPNPQFAPYRQSEKLDRYNQLIDELLKNGIAYKAYDSPAELDKQRNEQKAKGIFSFRYDPNWLSISEEEKNIRDNKNQFAIRIKLKKNHIYSWNDIVRGKIEFNNNDIGDFVIKKQDGYPTYNFAVVVDDHDMEISHVLRGEEHITNTPKQMAVYEALGWEHPNFGHLTIITNMEGKKLSKRDDSVKQFIENYKDEGYPSQAIFNFLVLLGWTHVDAKEMLSKNELIKSFSPERLSKSPSKFDIKKMEWFAKEYMKQTDNQIFEKQINFKDKDQEWITMFLDTYKQSAINIESLKISFKIYENNEIRKSDNQQDVVKIFKSELDRVAFNPDNIKQAIKNTQDISGQKGKNLFMPIRLATTYQEHGPELAKAIFLFGESIIKERIK